MTRVTTSRGASSASGCSSGMNRSPVSVTRWAPSPRTASETRNARPAVATAVGWNCTNSMWRTSAPARWAIAMPSPVAPGGFVVRE